MQPLVNMVAGMAWWQWSVVLLLAVVQVVNATRRRPWRALLRDPLGRARPRTLRCVDCRHHGRPRARRAAGFTEGRPLCGPCRAANARVRAAIAAEVADTRRRLAYEPMPGRFAPVDRRAYRVVGGGADGGGA